MMGIYCYKDTFNDNEIVYIGKDSNIHKNSRHVAHNSPSRYDEQTINRILQNNPKRYKYQVLKTWDNRKYHKNLSNALEIIYIHRYKPKFNFTVGGEGKTGLKVSDDTKNKISQTKKSNLDKISGVNNPRYHCQVPDPLELLNEYENGESTQKQLADKYGVTRGTIYYRINKALKIKGEAKHFRNKNKSPPPTFHGESHPLYKSNIPAPKELLKEYNETNMGIVQLSEKYGCSKSTIHRRLEKARKELNL